MDPFKLIPELSRGRKAEDWTYAPCVNYLRLSQPAREYLDQLPKFEAPESLGRPCFSHQFYQGKPNFFVMTVDREAYLVDTEGYDYARYVVQVTNLFTI